MYDVGSIVPAPFLYIWNWILVIQIFLLRVFDVITYYLCLFEYVFRTTKINFEINNIETFIDCLLEFESFMIIFVLSILINIIL